MTLRESLNDRGRSVHEQVDRILDSEDGMIVLVSRQTAVSYAQGFALSATQLELLALDIERLIRSSARGRRIRRTPREKRSHRDDDSRSVKQVA